MKLPFRRTLYALLVTTACATAAAAPEPIQLRSGGVNWDRVANPPGVRRMALISGQPRPATVTPTALRVVAPPSNAAYHRQSAAAYAAGERPTFTTLGHGHGDLVERLR